MFGWEDCLNFGGLFLRSFVVFCFFFKFRYNCRGDLKFVSSKSKLYVYYIYLVFFVWNDFRIKIMVGLRY